MQYKENYGIIKFKEHVVSTNYSKQEEMVMSGIFGMWQPGVIRKENKSELDKLQSWNKAYGSTLEALWANEALYLGCTLEKYREDAPIAAPVLKKNGCYAVIDALLYNREELLDAGDFSTKLSDEELLLEYIFKFGYKQLEQVNGDFSGAVYDAENNQVTLFRDHMGVRPLFYFMDDTSLSFSTDIRGLLAMEHTDVSVAEKWLWCKLAGGANFGTENTEFEHIYCVKPASYITFSVHGNKLQKLIQTYWTIGTKKVRLASEEAYKERLKELITDSIQRRLNAVSGLVAGELSGGLDSSIIDILIHRLGRDAAYFSWSASPEVIPYAENDERLIVKDICEQENITCHFRDIETGIGKESIIYQKTLAAGWKPELNAGLYRRYALPPYISTTQIAKVAQSAHDHGAKVVFTGHGGDETVSHRCNPYELFYHREYRHYWNYMWESARGNKHRLYVTLLRCHKNLTVSRKQLTSPFVSVLASKEMLKEAFFEKYVSQKGAPNYFAYDPLTYIRNGGSRNRLDIVALLGAYCGARYIAPYLDYRVADYAVSIPRNLYLKHGTNRYIFKETFKDMVPESLYTLTGKEDTSWRNVEKPEQDPAEYLEHKQRLMNMLDKEYWAEYLNWDEIETWANTPLASSDEMFDKAMYGGIDSCLSLQNLITFSKAAKPVEE